jgi:hypothetical protein
VLRAQKKEERSTLVSIGKIDDKNREEAILTPFKQIMPTSMYLMKKRLAPQLS